MFPKCLQAMNGLHKAAIGSSYISHGVARFKERNDPFFIAFRADEAAAVISLSSVQGWVHCFLYVRYYYSVICGNESSVSDNITYIVYDRYCNHFQVSSSLQSVPCMVQIKKSRGVRTHTCIVKGFHCILLYYVLDIYIHFKFPATRFTKR